jgi:hypothetical protein
MMSLYVYVRMNWLLVVCVHQTYCGADFVARRLLCKIDSTLDGILIGYGASVQCTYSRRLSEKEGFLRDEVEV